MRLHHIVHSSLRFALCPGRGVPLRAADSFCECVTFGVLGIWGLLRSSGGLGRGAVGRLLVVVGRGLLSSHAQRRTKEKQEEEEEEGKMKRGKK